MRDDVAAWQAQGTYFTVGDDQIFAMDVAATGDVNGDPILILHGFPSSSFDWRLVLPGFSAHRRVVLLDFPGFGLSDKPDRRYSIRYYADAAQSVVNQFGLTQVAMVTHDMGDTVGGELLARSMEGTLDFAITSRVVTNGSIYIDMAQLTNGQQMLLSLEDEPIDLAAFGLDPGERFRGGLADTFSASHPASDDELDAQWELASYNDGHKLLPRTIRYIEDRRAEERRFTGAIESHPSPLGVVWGVEDPIAVIGMVDELVAARPDANVTRLDGVAHYPMIEAPELLGSAVLASLTT